MVDKSIAIGVYSWFMVMRSCQIVIWASVVALPRDGPVKRHCMLTLGRSTIEVQIEGLPRLGDKLCKYFPTAILLSALPVEEATD